MIVAFNLFRRSKVCTRISLSRFHWRYFHNKTTTNITFFPLRCRLPCNSRQHPEKAALKTATSHKVHSAAEKVMLRFSAKLARIPARKRTTTSPPTSSLSRLQPRKERYRKAATRPCETRKERGTHLSGGTPLKSQKQKERWREIRSP